MVNKDDENNRLLLGDEELSELMLARFKAQGMPRDELRAKKTWEKLQAGLDAPAKSPWGKGLSIIGVAIAAGVIFGVGLRVWQQDQDLQQIKGPREIAPVELHTYVAEADGSMHTYDAQDRAIGREVIFKVWSPQKIFAALVKIDRNAEVDVLVRQITVEPGEETLLIEGEQDIRYTIESETPTYFFCIIAEYTPEELTTTVAHIKNRASYSRDGQCINL